MPRLKKHDAEQAHDTLEVIHHTVPDTAAGAGAAPIPARTYSDGGMTWRRMMRGIAITEVGGLTTLLVAGALYGLGFFAPLAIALVLWGVAAVLVPRMTKASTVYTLVVTSLTLVMFGGLFFGWTGFMYPKSWFEMTFATLTVLLPIAGIVAAVATLRHHDGNDAAKTPARVIAALATVIVLVGAVGTLATSDATRLPGDVTLTSANFEFEQEALTAKAGDVAIYFENEDPFVHNVKIEGKGTSANAEGGKSIRHVFKGMTAGTYEYLCAIHPDMKGTLTVT